MARPTKYRKRFIKEITEYFTEQYENYLGHDFSDEETVANGETKDGKKVRITKKSKRIVKVPTLFGFAISIGVGTSTLHDWSKEHKEFSDALSICKEMTAEVAVQGASSGLIQSNVARLIIVNSSTWRERQDVNHSSEDGTMTPKESADIDMSKCSDEQLQTLMDIRRKMDGAE